MPQRVVADDSEVKVGADSTGSVQAEDAGDAVIQPTATDTEEVESSEEPKPEEAAQKLEPTPIGPQAPLLPTAEGAPSIEPGRESTFTEVNTPDNTQEFMSLLEQMRQEYGGDVTATQNDLQDRADEQYQQQVLTQNQDRRNQAQRSQQYGEFLEDQNNLADERAQKFQEQQQAREGLLNEGRTRLEDLSTQLGERRDKLDAFYGEQQDLANERRNKWDTFYGEQQNQANQRNAAFQDSLNQRNASFKDWLDQQRASADQRTADYEAFKSQFSGRPGFSGGSSADNNWRNTGMSQSQFGELSRKEQRKLQKRATKSQRRRR